MLKLTPKEQKLLMLLAFLLILGVVLRFALPPDSSIAMQEGAAEKPVASMDDTGKTPTAISSVEGAEADKKNEKMIVVHMAGAVARPGVYHLPEGSRIYQLLEEAGGALADGELERINLAQPLVDGQQVFLPRKGEEGYEQKMLTGDGAAVRININTAGREQLESLPGIGAVKAQNIINYRLQNGPFQSIDNLLEVSGIGDKTLEGIKELITVW